MANSKTKSAPKKSKKKSANTAIESFLLENVGRHPSDLVALAMEEFEVSRPTVHSHLKSLLTQGLIEKSGSRNKVSYKKADTKIHKTWIEKIGPEGDENRIWEELFEPLVSKLPTTLLDILRYSVSEMVNNAIDHSNGKALSLRYEESKSKITIHIADNGVGIFRKISEALKLEDQREAILHLSKGKFTTDSANHTGQGIFFTSRAVDEFAIHSGTLVYMRHRKESDWLIETRHKPTNGTWITLTLEKNTTANLEEIFKTFADNEDPGFYRTHVMVQMARLTEESYVSRSQARRVMLGLDKFAEVILDFRDVRSVGQGFVDEVFRVFQNKHPKIKLVPIHMNPDVQFMVERGLKS